MSCKSAIYTVNDSVTSVLANGIIPLGTTIRRFGRNLYQSGNGIIACGEGYYDVKVSVTLSPTVAGTVTVTLLKDGVPVVGGTASETTPVENTPVNLAFASQIRLRCCDESATLTLRLTGNNASTNNVAIDIQKL